MAPFLSTLICALSEDIVITKITYLSDQLTLLSLLQTIMSENSDGGGGSQISALDDLLAGGVAGSASVIVGRELDLP